MVSGAAAIARLFGLSSLLVGLTVVALGTSTPELFISLQAALNGDPGIAIGNALGSNIANIGVVLGIAILVKPMFVESTLVKREFPFLLISMLLISLLLLDHDIDRSDGIIILVALLSFVGWLFWQSKHANPNDALPREYSQEIPTDLPIWQALVSVALGAVLLPLSAHVVILNILPIQHALGLADTVVGLSLVSLGTCLPELATAIIATLNDEADLAIGNVLGANIFNLLAVMPLPALIAPSDVAHSVLIRDMGSMFVITVLLFMFISNNRKLSRLKGAALLGTYLLYLGTLFYTQ